MKQNDLSEDRKITDRHEKEEILFIKKNRKNIDDLDRKIVSPSNRDEFDLSKDCVMWFNSYCSDKIKKIEESIQLKEIRMKSGDKNSDWQYQIKSDKKIRKEWSNLLNYSSDVFFGIHRK
jgi:hypothetical protein